MMRSALSKLMWVGSTTAAVIGLAVALAVVLGIATMALAAVPGDPFKLGQLNSINALTQLVGSRNGAMLFVANNSTAGGAHALNVQVDQGNPPIKVNSSSGTATGLSADRLDGKDISAFDARQVFIRCPGPLPCSGTYTSKGGTLVISASGSGFRSSGNTRREGIIGMAIFVDGVFYGRSEVFTNERDSHKAFIPQFLVVENLPAGSHTISFEDDNNTSCNTDFESVFHSCTTTNNGDFFNATVVEIPD